MQCGHASAAASYDMSLSFLFITSFSGCNWVGFSLFTWWQRWIHFPKHCVSVTETVNLATHVCHRLPDWTVLFQYPSVFYVNFYGICLNCHNAFCNRTVCFVLVITPFNNSYFQVCSMSKKKVQFLSTGVH